MTDQTKINTFTSTYTPLVFSQVVVDDRYDILDPTHIDIRILEADSDSFNYKIIEAESNDQFRSALGATFDYLVVHSVGDTNNFGTVETTHAAADTGLRSVAFLGQVQTNNGGDPTIANVGNSASNTITVRNDEDTSDDDETDHVQETIAFAGFEKGLIRNIHGEVIGASLDGNVSDSTSEGYIVNDDGWSTMNLNELSYLNHEFDFQKMVVLMGPTGVDDVYSRVSDINSDAASYSFQLVTLEGERFSSYDSFRVNAVILEEGTHTLADGTVITAGSSAETGGGETLIQSIPNSPEAETPAPADPDPVDPDPIVFTQIMTRNGGQAVLTRVDEVDEDGFSLRLQEPEGLDDWHVYERVGYLVVDPATEEASMTGEISVGTLVSNDDQSVTLSFDEEILLTDIQTYNGADPVQVVTNTFDNGQTRFFLIEEVSDDIEQSHVNEDVGYYNLGEGLIHNSNGEVIGGAFLFETDDPKSYNTVDANDYLGDDFDLEDMVVILGGDGNEDALMRIKNVSNQENSFDLRLENWDSDITPSVTETFSVYLIESGSHVLANGVELTAGFADVNHNWSDVII